MQNSVTNSARLVYSHAFSVYLNFAKFSNISFTDTPPVSEELLMAFSTHCFQELLLSYSTIKLYLCGIRFHYLASDMSTPRVYYQGANNSLPRLHLVLNGIKKSSQHSPRTSLPITHKILQSLCLRLQHGLFSSLLILCFKPYSW